MDAFIYVGDLWEKKQNRFLDKFSLMSSATSLQLLFGLQERAKLLLSPELWFLFLQHFSAPLYEIFSHCRICFHGSHMCLELMQLLEKSSLLWYPHSRGRRSWLYNGGEKKKKKKSQPNAYWNIKKRCNFNWFAFHPKLAILTPCIIFINIIIPVLM